MYAYETWYDRNGINVELIIMQFIAAIAFTTWFELVGLTPAIASLMAISIFGTIYASSRHARRHTACYIRYLDAVDKRNTEALEASRLSAGSYRHTN